jgi:uncharacterized protein (TIGR02246 family)
MIRVETEEEQMKTTLSAAALITALAVPALAQDGAKGVDAKWVKAFKAQDAVAVAALYAPDAVLWFPGTPEAKGKDAIQKTYQGFFDAYAVVDASLDAAQQTNGDLSSAWGHYVLTVKPKKGGDNVVLKGRYLDTAKKVGGQWVYVADHASAEPEPPKTP